MTFWQIILACLASYFLLVTSVLWVLFRLGRMLDR